MVCIAYGSFWVLFEMAVSTLEQQERLELLALVSIRYFPGKYDSVHD